MVIAPPIQPKPPLFTIPPAAVARHPAVLMAVRDLRSWIDTLPLANPPKATQMLLQQLRLLVRDPEPGPRLANLLKLYDRPIEAVWDMVESRQSGRFECAIPLDQLEYSLLELLTEAAYGRLRVANAQIIAGEDLAPDNLYRALTLIDHALTIERLHYCRLAPELWQLYLAIYLNAVAAGIADLVVEGELCADGDPPTIQYLFIRALMISLCDPHQHRPDQVASWSQWTGRHARLLRITPLPMSPFSIPFDVSGTMPPLTGARRGKPGPDMRYLDAEQFVAALLNDAEAPSGLHTALDALIKGRKASEQRQAPRQTRNHPYLLQIGLLNVHGRLQTLTQGNDATGGPRNPIACRQINQSVSGAAFRLQGPVHPPLAVGDLLLAESAVPSANGAPVGFAGRIRRIFTAEDQQIEIGVEKLVGRLLPVKITGKAAEQRRGDIQALLLQTASHSGYTLIASAAVFRKGEAITVEGATTRHGLRMDALSAEINRTGFIDVSVDSG